MRETLFIRLPGFDGEPCRWLLRGADGQVLGSQDSSNLAELGKEMIGRHVVAIAPSRDVLLTTIAFPARDRGKLLKALPYALEDSLATDVEGQHFALPAHWEKGGTVPVAVVSRSIMEEWLDWLKACDLQAHAIVPDVLLLPQVAEGWTVCREGSTALVRQDTHAGFSTDAAQLLDWIKLALDSAETPPRHLSLVECDGSEQSDSTALAQLRADIDVEPASCNGTVIELLSANYDERTTLNLLQGPYSRRERLGPLWRPWRRVAALFAVWVVIALLSAGGEAWYLKQQNAALRAQIENLFKTAFPEAQNIVNPRVQMEQRLAALRGSQSMGESGYLDLLRRASEPLRTTENMTVTSLNYRDGALDIELNAADFRTLESLKQRLQENALNVEIVSASAAQERVIGRLRLSGGTGA